MLEEIILKISTETNFQNVGNILKEYCDDDWKKYVKIDNERYCRNKIFENENIEILIISWNKNQNAPIHDHSCNGCWLKVLKGELIENRYAPESLALYQNICMKTNDVSFMKNNIGYHSIFNNTDDIAVTIHIYNPPNHKTKFFV